MLIGAIGNIIGYLPGYVKRAVNCIALFIYHHSSVIIYCASYGRYTCLPVIESIARTYIIHLRKSKRIVSAQHKAR